MLRETAPPLRAFPLIAAVAVFACPASSLAAKPKTSAKPTAAAKATAKPAAKAAGKGKPSKARPAPAARARKKRGPEFRIDRSRWEETDELPAVQNRRFWLQHEIAAGVSHIPLDPYTKGVAVTGGYTWHLNHTWGIEGHFGWVFNYRASLREELENNFGEPETKFRRMNWYAKLGTLFKPLYGKLAFFNDSQVYGEFYLTAYVVVAQLEGGEKTENETAGRGQRIAVGPAPGFGLRGFLTRSLSVRFDFNWMVLFTGGFLAKGDSPFEVDAPLTLTLTLAYTLNFGDDG
jgi:outer membrane beta-barrel protein